MDKESIANYLMQIKDLMEKGRFIKAYKELVFVIDNVVNDVRISGGKGK